MKIMDGYDIQKVQIQNLEQEKQNIQKQKQNLEDARLCKICMENEICYVFIPCGHQITCENCAVNGEFKICPVCRQPIEKRFKTFFS